MASVVSDMLCLNKFIMKGDIVEIINMKELKMYKMKVCADKKILEDESIMYLAQKLLEEMDEIDATYSDYLDNLSEKDIYQK